MVSTGSVGEEREGIAGNYELVRLLGVAPLPQDLARGLAHGDEQLVVAERLHHAGEQHEVAVGDDVELQQVVLREEPVPGPRFATSLVQRLLPDGEFRGVGVARWRRR